MRKFVAIGVLVLGSLLFSTPSPAVKVQRLSLSKLYDKAQTILLATVTKVSTRTNAQGNMIWTDYALKVEESLHGPWQRPNKAISFAGGQYAGQSYGVMGVPTLKVGQRYVLFLMSDNKYAVPTVGWGQGIFAVHEVQIDTTKQEVLISYDGEPLELSEQNKLQRGLRLNVMNNTLTLPVAQTSNRSDTYTREKDPEVQDAQGNITTATSQERQPQRQSLAERKFATIDNLRAFIRGELESAD